MSWELQAQQDFTVVTPDGKSYMFVWMNPTKLKEYNITEFDFINQDGSYVDRRSPRGMKYSLELFFVGDNHLDQSAAFDISTNDRRPWKIAHPYYGNLLVQPASILFDNTEYNVTKITAQVIATITQQNPTAVVDPLTNILFNKQALDTISLNALSATPSVTDQNTIINNNSFAYKKGLPAITLPADAQNYTNIFNAGNSALNALTIDPLVAMQQAQTFINAPAAFTLDVQSRVNLLTTQFNYLRGTNGSAISGFKTPASKQLYQLQGCANISATLLAAATPLPGNYTKMADVIYIIDIITNNYNYYLLDLDIMQTLTGGHPDSYIADPTTLTALNDLVNYTISSLFQIALLAAQQRSFILDNDSNIILLTHKLYGLDAADNNMNELIANNGWGITQMLGIKKGTTINYYI